ncbi:MAG: COPI associated protein-domain-containing protein [Benniella sp.]|nr:MAG: COPI associated protein-domain-containing protein [Benniella sp.]
MLRLGWRGIVLSLFINALNIVLYLTILVAACLNIAEAPINFIILNVFAASIACLLVVSEVRLPRLTYEYFRFLCTYRGRGMTYLFFGCLVVSKTPFNLYGGIIVVCMGLAFLMLSYVKLVPPLDGLLLNYKKLGQWKEQKHFRVQLEAQRIFEQQLQQEQNLTRLVPAHHHSTSMTVHASMMAVSRPHQPKAFSAIHAGSTGFSSAGVGTEASPSGGLGTPASIFSPSTSQRPSNYPRLAPQTQQHQRVDQERQFQYHQHPKYHGSTSNVESEKGPQEQEAQNVDGTAIGRGKGCGAHGSSSQETLRMELQPSFQLDKYPPINTSEKEGMTALPWPPAFALSPPPTRRGSAVDSEPESPLQYLIVDDPSEATSTIAFGGKAEWNQSGSLDDRILKSALHQGDKTSRPLQQQQQFPLRTTNKPAPPHDPFRRASLPSKQLVNATPPSNPAFGTSANVKSGKGYYQSFYHMPPEPPGQPDSIHPLQSYHDPSARSNQVAMTPPSNDERRSHPIPPLTATGQILSSIGRMSGIVGGIPGSVAPYHPNYKGSHCAPNSIQHGYHNQHHHQHLDQTETRAAITSENAPQPQRPMASSTQHQQQRSPVSKQDTVSQRHHMPDIILTLPTPAEPINTSRREGYFAM